MIASASGASVWTRTRPAPPRATAPGELGHQREGPLLGPEVREAKARIGVDDHRQDDVGEVVALRDHLRSDQDGGLSAVELAQDRRVSALPRGGVRVEPQAPEPARRARTTISATRSEPGAVARDRHGSALRAALRHALGVAAVVAAHGVARAMEHQRDVAVGAVPGMPAYAAVEERRPAAPAAPSRSPSRLPRQAARAPRECGRGAALLARRARACRGPRSLASASRRRARRARPAPGAPSSRAVAWPCPRPASPAPRCARCAATSRAS